MKNAKRLIALIAAVLMLMVLLAACQDPEKKPGETTDPAETNGSVDSDKGVDDEGYELDKLPDDLDYGGAAVRILYWSDVERIEFESDKITGDNIGDAIYERNGRIEDRLGVTLEFIGEPGNNGKRVDFVKRVENSFTAGLSEYDIVATYSRTAGMLAIGGYLADLHNIDDSYIDESMPWWPESITDTMGVGDALYYISGDASTNTLHFMYTIYYNKDMLASYELTDPTEYVLNKTWTLDKLIEMSSNVYQDLDSSGNVSEGDTYGFTTIYYGCDAFYTGSNLKLVEGTNNDDLIKISGDFFSEKAVNLVDKLGKWLTTNDCYVSRSGASVNFQVPFVNGSALFMQNRVYVADVHHGSGLNAVEWKYGLVPTPLYDENQTEYVTVIGNPFTLYGILSNCSQKTMMTAVIECWGSEAYRLTTPALFETNMKYKYTSEEIYAQMFDILRETSSFDQGRIFSNDLNYMSELPSTTMTNGASWTTAMNGYKNVLNNKIKNVISSFQKILSK